MDAAAHYDFLPFFIAVDLEKLSFSAGVSLQECKKCNLPRKWLVFKTYLEN